MGRDGQPMGLKSADFAKKRLEGSSLPEEMDRNGRCGTLSFAGKYMEILLD